MDTYSNTHVHTCSHMFTHAHVHTHRCFTYHVFTHAYRHFEPDLSCFACTLRRHNCNICRVHMQSRKRHTDAGFLSGHPIKKKAQTGSEGRLLTRSLPTWHRCGEPASHTLCLGLIAALVVYNYIEPRLSGWPACADIIQEVLIEPLPYGTKSRPAAPCHAAPSLGP